MKTKNKFKIYDFLLENGVILACLVWFIATIFLVYLIFYSYQEEFTIYKNECENETIEEYYNFPNDFKITKCPEEFIKIPCYDNRGSLIIGLACKKQNFFCYKLKNGTQSILIQEIKTFAYEIFNWYEIEPYTESNSIKKSKTIKPVCNKLKVFSDYEVKI